MRILGLFFTIITLVGCTEKVLDYSKLEIKEISGTKTAFLDGERFTGKAAYTLSNGVLLFQYTFKNGLYHGAYEAYYNSGVKQKEGFYNNGLQDGDYKEYYESGPLKYHYVWANEKKDGVWKSYYENGQQWTQRDFKNDILDGKVLVWDEEGRLGKEQTYRNGVQIEKINHFENFEDK